ncbi:hypothetical protein DDM91_19195, partial [Vibrio cholerae]|nr:hypothetical protein [Vibrio cholerae]
MNDISFRKRNTIKPTFTQDGIFFNGNFIEKYGEIDRSTFHEDPLHYKRKFGLIVPATNTTMEKEIWSILINNYDVESLDGIGFHTSNVITPRPEIKNQQDIERYKASFLAGLQNAINVAKLSDPEHLILGMSLEHILYGIDEVSAPVDYAISTTDLNWSTCHQAMDSALEKYQAKNIGIITPFEAQGNMSAKKMFHDLGYNVVA